MKCIMEFPASLDSNLIIAIATSVSSLTAVFSFFALLYAIYISIQANKISKSMVNQTKSLHDDNHIKYENFYWAKMMAELAISSSNESEFYQKIRLIMDIYGAKEVVHKSNLDLSETIGKLKRYASLTERSNHIVELEKLHMKSVESGMHNICSSD